MKLSDGSNYAQIVYSRERLVFKRTKLRNRYILVDDDADRLFIRTADIDMIN